MSRIRGECMDRDASPKKGLRRILRVTLLTAVGLLFLDVLLGGCFIVLKHVRDRRMYYTLFDFGEAHRAVVEDSAAAHTHFLTEYYDPRTGWNNPKSGRLRSLGCSAVWEAHYGPDGARKNCGVSDKGPYPVLCVGDSFTHGNEVEDCSSYPAVLEQLLGVRVGNFGVGGFDVIQSVLQFEAVLERTVPPKVAILGVMYENGRRNLNSFRPVYSKSFDPYEVYLFKPYFDGASIVHAQVRNNTSHEACASMAETAFTADFWAAPRCEFPYMASLGRAMSSNGFLFALRQKINGLLGRGVYAADYADDRILAGLNHAINRFIDDCSGVGARPVVLFIPPTPRDLTSAKGFIADLQRDRPSTVFLDFAERVAQSDRRLLVEGCHPTVEGYAELAGFVAERIAPLLR